jgi:hypothetical protein
LSPSHKLPQPPFPLLSHAHIHSLPPLSPAFSFFQGGDPALVQLIPGAGLRRLQTLVVSQQPSLLPEDLADILADPGGGLAGGLRSRAAADPCVCEASWRHTQRLEAITYEAWRDGAGHRLRPTSASFHRSLLHRSATSTLHPSGLCSLVRLEARACRHVPPLCRRTLQQIADRIRHTSAAPESIGPRKEGPSGEGAARGEGGAGAARERAAVHVVVGSVSML